MKGLTLLEVLISIFVLTVGLGGSFALLTRTIAASSAVGHQLQASYLAQEGVEIVRNMRDTNFIKMFRDPGGGWSWTDGLTGCATGCEADFNDSQLAADDRFLLLDGETYSYDSGTQTPFKRKIFVAPDGSDALEVRVTVSWAERSASYAVSADTLLYQWYTP